MLIMPMYITPLLSAVLIVAVLRVCDITSGSNVRRSNFSNGHGNAIDGSSLKNASGRWSELCLFSKLSW